MAIARTVAMVLANFDRNSVRGSDRKGESNSSCHTKSSKTVLVSITTVRVRMTTEVLANMLRLTPKPNSSISSRYTDVFHGQSSSEGNSDGKISSKTNSRHTRNGHRKNSSSRSTHVVAKEIIFDNAATMNNINRI